MSSSSSRLIVVPFLSQRSSGASGSSFSSITGVSHFDVLETSSASDCVLCSFSANLESKFELKISMYSYINSLVDDVIVLCVELFVLLQLTSKFRVFFGGICRFPNVKLRRFIEIHFPALLKLLSQLLKCILSNSFLLLLNQPKLVLLVAEIETLQNFKVVGKRVTAIYNLRQHLVEFGEVCSLKFDWLFNDSMSMSRLASDFTDLKAKRVLFFSNTLENNHKNPALYLGVDFASSLLETDFLYVRAVVVVFPINFRVFEICNVPFDPH